jgi:voltage-gated potassium channel
MIKEFLNTTYNRRFIILWGTFLFALLIPKHNTLLEGNYLRLLSAFFILMAGVNILIKRHKSLRWIIVIALFSWGFELISIQFLPQVFSLISSISFLLFYALVIYELIKEILGSKDVSFNTIAAAFSIYYIIALLFAVIFTIVETNFPGSFNGLDTNLDLYSQLEYFSFISITTIGYGDITPNMEFTQRLSLILGLIGNFYSTVIVAIILSRYLLKYNKDK